MDHCRRFDVGMSRTEKLKLAFAVCSGPFEWRDFERLLANLGYAPHGKGSGSGRTFIHGATNDIIRLHEPHDGIMGAGMVKRLQDHLRRRGLL